jgi:hypothetical protein
MNVTKADADWAAFKVPTLRNIAKTAPYFHDGSAPDLTAAVKLMAGGGVPNKNLTPMLSTVLGLAGGAGGKLLPALIPALGGLLGGEGNLVGTGGLSALLGALLPLIVGMLKKPAHA